MSWGEIYSSVDKSLFAQEVQITPLIPKKNVLNNSHLFTLLQNRMLKSSRLLEFILPQIFLTNIDCSATDCQNFGKYYVPYFWAKCLEIVEDQYLRSKGWRIGHYSCNVQSAVLWPSFFWKFSEIDPSKPNIPNIPFGIPALALKDVIG